MKYNKIKKITLSLMKSESEIKVSGNTDYVIKASGKFVKPSDFYKDLLIEEQESLTIGLLNSMYNDVREAAEDDIDSVGLWVEYDGEIFENSIKIEILDDMNRLGTDDVIPIYEFFKMSTTKKNKMKKNEKINP